MSAPQTVKAYLSDAHARACRTWDLREPSRRANDELELVKDSTAEAARILEDVEPAQGAWPAWHVYRGPRALAQSAYRIPLLNGLAPIGLVVDAAEGLAESLAAFVADGGL